MSVQNKLFRYPGMRPFDNSYEELFFGRENDIKELIHRIHLEEQFVLYGKSGLGKTSLLNAGVIPPLERDGYFVFNVRFGSFSKEMNFTPTDILRQNISAHVIYDNFLWTKILRFSPENIDKIKNYNEVLEALEDPWYYCQSILIQQPEIKTFLFVFDQFEELFNFPDKQINEFGKAFSKLLNIKAPQQVRSLIKEKGKDLLSQEEIQLLLSPLNIKVIFSIRSDKMSALNKLKDYFPQILKKTHELEPLNIEQAKNAITKPAESTKYEFVSPVFKYADEAINNILQYLSKSKEEIREKKNIESFQLQIICQHIENMVIKNKINLITTKDIGDIDKILRSFYDEKIKTFSKKERNNVKDLIEKGLIYAEDERRLNLFEGQILKTYNLSKEVLMQLVNSHLLRLVPNHSGDLVYELSHDTLVAPILKARKERERRNQIFNMLKIVAVIVLIVTSSALIYNNRVNEKLKNEVVNKYNEYYSEGENFEKEINYVQAKESYKRAKDLLSNDSIEEKIAYCEKKLEDEIKFNRFIREAESLDSLKIYIKSLEILKKADSLKFDPNLYEKLIDPRKKEVLLILKNDSTDFNEMGDTALVKETQNKIKIIKEF